MYFAIYAIFMVVLVSAEDKYDSSIDLNELLGNDRLITSYSKCLINKGPCTPEVKKFKDRIPEILETRCEKCSDNQKQLGKKLVTEVKSKHPEIWSELAKVYDPQGKYKQSFEEFIKA